jgi:uncharacterized protein YndB with AHSA1/START domain
MSTMLFPVGRIRRTDTGFQGHLSRDLEHEADAVWAMLTESASMAQWLAPGSIQQQLGGAVRIDFADSGTVIDSAVTAFEPGRVLEYSWSSGEPPQRPLRWELHPRGGGTRLELFVDIPAGEDVAKACAGFEGHLEMLATALEGVPTRFPFDLFVQTRKSYAEQVARLG